MQIRIQHQDGREECRTLDASQTLRCGTRRSADVVLQGTGIFPIHLGIVYYGGAFTVAASQQAREISVNGVHVRKTTLSDGDRIELGGNVITVIDDELADPLAGLSDDVLNAGVLRESALEPRSARRPGAPAERTGPSTFARIVRSPWVARALVACALLPLATLVGIYIGELPTADDRFQAAADAYRQEDFARAMEGFDRFLARHPRHALADEARMKRDTARLLDRFDRGTDALTLIGETRVAADGWRGRQMPPDVQSGLAQILPRLVGDLIQLSPTAAQRGAGEAARDAQAGAAEGLQLIYEFLPASMQRDSDVDRLQSALTTLERDSAQAAAVDAAVAAIGRAAAAGDLAAIHRARQALLSEYPQVASDTQLVQALRQVAQGDAVRATLKATCGLPAAAAPRDTRWTARVILAPAAVAPSADVEPQAVHVAVPEAGTIFGLDAASGRVLWRRVNEARSLCAADPDAPRDYLVAKEAFVCVLSREPLDVLSVYYLGHEPGCIWLPPFVVGNHLLVFEQIGPRQTNLHVLRRGDPLQEVQLLLLGDAVVGAAPAVLGEYVYLPTDNGRLRALRFNASEVERPFADQGEISVPGVALGAPACLQLATAGDRLLIGGQGVTVGEPAGGATLAFAQRIWDDLQITQPLQVAGGIVVAAGRSPAQTGVEACAWDITAGQTLWTSSLAVPLQAPPLVRAKEGDVWFLSAREAVYRVPVEQLAGSNKETMIVAPCDGPSKAPSPPGAVRGAALSGDGLCVLGPSARGDAVWLIAAQDAAGKATRTSLPRPLAVAPVTLGTDLLLLVPPGVLSLYDARRHETVATMLLPDVTPSAQRSWQTPAVISDQECAITDGRSNVFLVRIRADRKGLEISGQTTIEPPLVSPLVAVSGTIWGVDREQRLVALSLPDMTRAAIHQLTGALQWGPRVLGACGYVATDDGTLYCVGTAGEPHWVAALGCGAIVGGCMVDRQHVAVASASGYVWILDSESGQCPGGPIDLRQPLAGGPVLAGDRLAVVTKDGCVLVSEESADGLLREGNAAR